MSFLHLVGGRRGARRGGGEGQGGHQQGGEGAEGGEGHGGHPMWCMAVTGLSRAARKAG